MKFEIFKDKAGKFRFRLKATNGEILLASEAYESKAGCKNGIESVKANAPEKGRFDRKDSTNGKFYFTLKAKNHQVIGISEIYDTEKARDNGIESVMKNAPGATVAEVA